MLLARLSGKPMHFSPEALCCCRNAFQVFAFMKRRRAFLVIFISWAIPVITTLAFFRMNWLCPGQRLLFEIFTSVNIIFLAFLPCCGLVFCFAAMLIVVNKHERAARVLAKQLHFNH